MKILSKALLVFSFLCFLAWILHLAEAYLLPGSLQWVLICTGAVSLIVSWLIQRLLVKEAPDPFGLDKTEATENPDYISYMVAFSIYAVCAIGIFWYLVFLRNA